jgi:hypothetical protein
MPMCNRELRQTGRTTRICNSARKNNDIVVCYNSPMAKMIKRKHHVETECLDALINIRGSEKNIVFDHYVQEKYPYLCNGLTVYQAICLLEENNDRLAM